MPTFSPFYHQSTCLVCNTGSCGTEVHDMPLLLLLPSYWHPLASGGDDRSTLSRLPLRPHWILGLLPAVRLPSGWIWGRPPSSSRCRPILTSQNQGGAERRCSQEEGQESRVGRSAAPVNLHLTLRHHGLHVMGLPIPFQGKRQFDVLPNETLSIRAKWCFLHFPQHKDSVNTTAQPGHFKPKVFMCSCTSASVLNTVWRSTCRSCMGLRSTLVSGVSGFLQVHQTLFQFRKK